MTKDRLQAITGNQSSVSARLWKRDVVFDPARNPLLDVNIKMGTAESELPTRQDVRSPGKRALGTEATSCRALLTHPLSLRFRGPGLRHSQVQWFTRLPFRIQMSYISAFRLTFVRNIKEWVAVGGTEVPHARRAATPHPRTGDTRYPVTYSSSSTRCTISDFSSYAIQVLSLVLDDAAEPDVRAAQHHRQPLDKVKEVIGGN